MPFINIMNKFLFGIIVGYLVLNRPDRLADPTIVVGVTPVAAYSTDPLFLIIWRPYFFTYAFTSSDFPWHSLSKIALHGETQDRRIQSLALHRRHTSLALSVAMKALHNCWTGGSTNPR